MYDQLPWLSIAIPETIWSPLSYRGHRVGGRAAGALDGDRQGRRGRARQRQDRADDRRVRIDVDIEIAADGAREPDMRQRVDRLRRRHVVMADGHVDDDRPLAVGADRAGAAEHAVVVERDRVAVVAGAVDRDRGGRTGPRRRGVRDGRRIGDAELEPERVGREDGAVCAARGGEPAAGDEPRQHVFHCLRTERSARSAVSWPRMTIRCSRPSVSKSKSPQWSQQWMPGKCSSPK